MALLDAPPSKGYTAKGSFLFGLPMKQASLITVRSEIPGRLSCDVVDDVVVYNAD